MTKEQNVLVGALVGLARSLDESNTRLEALETMERALRCLARGENCEESLAAVRGEKRRAVPDCSVCQNPCGRTDDLTGAEVAELDEPRKELLHRLLAWAAGEKPRSFGEKEPSPMVRGLYALGYPWFTPEELEDIKKYL